MNHGIVDVFAYQEALLIEAVFGIALLAMIWVGFRRWLQHKERMGQLIAEQTAERAVQHDAQMERVEGRLKTIEQIVTGGEVPAAAQIDAGTDAGVSAPRKVRLD
jgi:predicted phage tail protein